ncbi:hypothetical protein ABT369_07905 [Dactylosporangium sp. NPDC000244]|uniref:hypothetical protein n=1 Tax=Dactylosporangium sp. NPDC000244 TaxID=3154365 RepID=UPI00331FFA74
MSGAAAAASDVTVTYYAPYKWAIVTRAYGPDADALTGTLDKGRRDMLITFAVAAVLLALVVGAIAWYWARRVAGQLTGLTGALARIAAIRADTEGAVAAIDAITEAIDRVSEYQRAIAGAVEEQTATTDEMQRNVQRAATASGAIAADIDGVNSSVATAQRAVETSRAAASRLNANAATLTALVSRFRL